MQGPSRMRCTSQSRSTAKRIGRARACSARIGTISRARLISLSMYYGLRRLARARRARVSLAVVLATTPAGAQQTRGQAEAKTVVSLRFSWKLKGEYAPLFVAREKGFFTEQGLD